MCSIQREQHDKCSGHEEAWHMQRPVERGTGEKTATGQVVHNEAIEVRRDESIWSPMGLLQTVLIFIIR